MRVSELRCHIVVTVWKILFPRGIGDELLNASILPL
jgi:hypothetical protein